MSHDETHKDTLNEDRDPLEILADEYAEALRSGASPSIEEFARRLPDRSDQVQRLLQSISVFERIGDREHQRFRALRNVSRLVEGKIESLGDFRIIREIGRGGMGVIYEAEQLSLKRRVALKVLSANIEHSAKQLDRFRRESEAIARLHHTNIVPVFGVGEENGIHYFAMQLIDGKPLSDPIELSFEKIAHIGFQAASALAYAHQHGVLHRDVKPSNLLLDVEGDLWVTDFGLAKLTNDAGLTHDGDIVGTLRYMAPEQLDGRSDQRTDVYGLGLTLYELITQRPAFDQSQSLATRIRCEGFVSPRSINPSLARDLETIVLKATARDPHDRYQTASSMAEDLQRFIDDRPILARRSSAMERLRRWCRRNPAVALSSSLALVLLVATTCVSAIGFIITKSALDEAKVARGNSDRATSMAKQSQARAESNLNVATDAFDSIFANVAARGAPHSMALNIDDEDVPQFESTLTSADAALLESLLGFYREFAKQNETDNALLSKTAIAYRKIGQIQHRLGNLAAAHESYHESIAMFRTLHSQSPNQHDFLIALAETLNDNGIALATNLQFMPQIGELHREAARLLRDQSPQVAELPRVRFELARSLDLSGSVLTRAGAAEEALDQGGGRDGRGPRGGGRRGDPRRGRGPEGPPPFDGRRQNFRGAPPDMQPAWPPGQSGPPSPWSQSPIGPPPRGSQPPGPPGFGNPRGMAESIDRDLDEATSLLSELCVEDSENSDYQLALAQVQRHRLIHFLVTDRAMLATNAFRLATDTLNKLVHSHPNEPRFLFELGDTLSWASTRLGSISDLDADEYLNQAITISKRLCDTFPSVPEYHALLARSFRMLGGMKEKRDEIFESQRLMMLAVEELQFVATRYPENNYYQTSLLVAVNRLAQVRLTRVPPETPNRSPVSLIDVRNILLSAIDRNEKLSTGPGPRPNHIAMSYDLLSRVYAILGEMDLSKAARDEAIRRGAPPMRQDIPNGRPFGFGEGPPPRP